MLLLYLTILNEDDDLIARFLVLFLTYSCLCGVYGGENQQWLAPPCGRLLLPIIYRYSRQPGC